MQKNECQDRLILPKQFEAAGIAAGIKVHGQADMALLISRVPAVCAGTFTTNKVKAASVKLCMERLAKSEQAYGVVINSGNANACTGLQGMRDAARMTEVLADELGVAAQGLYVCSTGHIGDFLPMERVEQGIRSAVKALSAAGGDQAAKAIMTTDTHEKTVMRVIEIDGQPVRITGLAKGSGMIEPNMATMLGFLLTDAVVDRGALQRALKAAVASSFNRISVDGDTSTNDTVLCLANGAAQNKVLNATHPQWGEFCTALKDAAFDLAMQIIGDGEGAKKIVTVQIQGAANDAEADQAARAIANSLLVKTSWVKRDANWGRIMDVLGYSGVELQESSVDIYYDELPAVHGGMAGGTPTEELEAVVGQAAFTVKVDLHIGIGSAVVYTCECTEEYIRINI